MRAIVSCLCAAVLVHSGDAGAQTETVAQPPSLIIPNYNRFRVGKDEALQGGAFIARTKGAAANVYNPAGLAQAKGTEIAASSTGYEYLKLEVAGTSKSTSTTTLVGLGSYFGLVLAEPLPLERWRFGFSVSQPLDWSPPALSGAFPVEVAAQPERQVRFTASGRLNSTVPALAAGFAASPSLRFGVSVGVPILSYSQHGTVDARAVGDSSATVAVRDATVSGDAFQLRVTGGAQWDIVPALTLGLVVTSPTWTWSSSGRLSGHRGNYSGTALVDGWLIDDDAGFDYEQPFELGGGLAFHLGRAELEADVRWHGANDGFTMFTSDATGIRTVTDAAGVPSTTMVGFEPTVVRWRDVVNFAVGGHVDLGRRTRIHLGFFTDRSPVMTETTVFPKIDLYGGTGGISFAIGKVISGSVGLSYTTGTSVRGPVADVEGTPVQTEVKLTIFQLLYSISFEFGGP